jgi:hypothetical protein
LHDIACRHDASRDSGQPAVYDIRDEKFVGREVVLVAGVVPDIRVAVFLVGLIFGACPLPDALFRRGAVPLTVSEGYAKHC